MNDEENGVQIKLQTSCWTDGALRIRKHDGELTELHLNENTYLHMSLSFGLHDLEPANINAASLPINDHTWIQLVRGLLLISC